MPINVIGNSNSNNSENRFDTNLFLQKPYLRSNYIEPNTEEDIDLKNQCRNNILPDPINTKEAASKNFVDNKLNDPSIIKSNNPHPDIDLYYKNSINVGLIEINRMPESEDQLTSNFYVDNLVRNSVDESISMRFDPDEKLNLNEQDSIPPNSTLTSPKTILEVPTKIYVDNKFNDPSIIRNNAHVDFNDKNLVNVRFVKVNSMPDVREHLTPNFYVDNAISDWLDELSLRKLGPNEELNLDEQDSKIPISSLTSPKTIVEIPTKSYVDSLNEINRNRRDLSSVFNDQHNEFDSNKLTNLDSIKVNRDLSSDNELANKKYIDDSIGEGTILRFNQTLENYRKASVGDDTNNLTEYDKIQITDTTIIKYPTTGGYLLKNWVIKCNDKNNNGKIPNFIKSTKTNSPTGYSGAESLPPIGNSFMYIETSSNNHGNDVFVSFERIDFNQISNKTFYYNRFSILTNDSLKSMGRFRIQ